MKRSEILGGICILALLVMAMWATCPDELKNPQTEASSQAEAEAEDATEPVCQNGVIDAERLDELVTIMRDDVRSLRPMGTYGMIINPGSDNKFGHLAPIGFLGVGFNCGDGTCQLTSSRRTGLDQISAIVREEGRRDWLNVDTTYAQVVIDFNPPDGEADFGLVNVTDLELLAPLTDRISEDSPFEQGEMAAQATYCMVVLAFEDALHDLL